MTKSRRYSRKKRVFKKKRQLAKKVSRRKGLIIKKRQKQTMIKRTKAEQRAGTTISKKRRRGSKKKVKRIITKNQRGGASASDEDVFDSYVKDIENFFNATTISKFIEYSKQEGAQFCKEIYNELNKSFNHKQHSEVTTPTTDSDFYDKYGVSNFSKNFFGKTIPYLLIEYIFNIDKDFDDFNNSKNIKTINKVKKERINLIKFLEKDYLKNLDNSTDKVPNFYKNTDDARIILKHPVLEKIFDNIFKENSFFKGIPISKNEINNRIENNQFTFYENWKTQIKDGKLQPKGHSLEYFVYPKDETSDGLKAKMTDWLKYIGAKEDLDPNKQYTKDNVNKFLKNSYTKALYKTDIVVYNFNKSLSTPKKKELAPHILKQYSILFNKALKHRRDKTLPFNELNITSEISKLDRNFIGNDDESFISVAKLFTQDYYFKHIFKKAEQNRLNKIEKSSNKQSKEDLLNKYNELLEDKHKYDNINVFLELFHLLMNIMNRYIYLNKYVATMIRKPQEKGRMSKFSRLTKKASICTDKHFTVNISSNTWCCKVEIKNLGLHINLNKNIRKREGGFFPKKKDEENIDCIIQSLEDYNNKISVTNGTVTITDSADRSRNLTNPVKSPGQEKNEKHFLIFAKFMEDLQTLNTIRAKHGDHLKNLCNFIKIHYSGQLKQAQPQLTQAQKKLAQDSINYLNKKIEQCNVIITILKFLGAESSTDISLKDPKNIRERYKNEICPQSPTINNIPYFFYNPTLVPQPHSIPTMPGHPQQHAPQPSLPLSPTFDIALQASPLLTTPPAQQVTGQLVIIPKERKKHFIELKTPGDVSASDWKTFIENLIINDINSKKFKKAGEDEWQNGTLSVADDFLKSLRNCMGVAGTSAAVDTLNEIKKLLKQFYGLDPHNASPLAKKKWYLYQLGTITFNSDEYELNDWLFIRTDEDPNQGKDLLFPWCWLTELEYIYKSGEDQLPDPDRINEVLYGSLMPPPPSPASRTASSVSRSPSIDLGKQLLGESFVEDTKITILSPFNSDRWDDTEIESVEDRDPTNEIKKKKCVHQ